MRRFVSFRFPILVAILVVLVLGGCVWSYHTHEGVRAAPDDCLLCQMVRGSEKFLPAHVDYRAVPILSGPLLADFHAGQSLRPPSFISASRAPPFSISL